MSAWTTAGTKNEAMSMKQFKVHHEREQQDGEQRGRSRRARHGLGVLAMLIATGCASASVSSPAEAQSLGGSKPVVVGMKALKYNPKSVTVKVKQRVDFRWDESVAHNVVFDKNRKSKTLAKKGSIWSTSFDKEGTYKYKCTLHPGMAGDVKVVK
jgi:plastocyanin